MKMSKFRVSIRKRSCATKTFIVVATDCETAEKGSDGARPSSTIHFRRCDYECYYDLMPDGRAIEVGYDRPLAISIREEK